MLCARNSSNQNGGIDLGCEECSIPNSATTVRRHRSDFINKSDAGLIFPPNDSANAKAGLGQKQQALRPRARSSRDMVEGLSNRLIGEHLAISPRTAELNRANVLAKSGAKHSTMRYDTLGDRGFHRAISTGSALGCLSGWKISHAIWLALPTETYWAAPQERPRSKPRSKRFARFSASGSAMPLARCAK